MLSTSKTFTSFSVPNLEEAMNFYSSKLELNVSEDVPGVLMIKTAGDTKFMVYIKPNHIPAEFTVLNFEVEDIEDVIKWLGEKGIKMEMYPDMNQNEKGITETPGGGKMAWFKDPAGNILSLLSA